MKIKFLLSVLLSFSISIAALAQMSPGIEYFKLGENKLAKDILNKEMSQNPARSYYYLGEIAYKEGNIAEAKANYEKGLAADPENALNQIGIAKLQLKSDPKETDKTLSNIAKKNKKDVLVIIEVAQAYLDNGLEKEALEKASDARKSDKNSPWVYIFEGDVYAKALKAGDAAAQYEQAFTFDPNCMVAYVKYAKVYEGINQQAATDMLQKALDVHPDFIILNKYIGDLYYRRAIYAKAIEAYSKYFAGGDYSTNDITNYAATKYFTKDYDGANQLINEGLKRESDNFVLNRLLMYTQNELHDYANGLLTAKHFFKLRNNGNDSTYIVQDFTAYANMLKETGDLDAAIVQYQKAIELDKSQVSIYKDIASTLSSEKKNAEAAQIYAKYVATVGEAAEATDYFQLGRYYYMAASNISKSDDEESLAKKLEYIAEGDKAFAKVAELIPDSHLGNFWRARIQAIADPDSKEGLGKPYYEASIQIINAKGDHNNDKELVEAYSYLSYYWYVQWIEASNAKNAAATAEAKENTKLNVEKLLELDPTNNIGITLKDAVK